MDGPVTFQLDPPLLKQDASGAIRLGSSRLLLDLVIRAYQDGATPEEIAERHAADSLADVYGAITYYLRHPSEVKAYLSRREELARQVRAKVEARQGGLAALRERLRARAANP